MDPAQGESGGKSLTSKLKSKVHAPNVKGKVKSLKSKVRLPGMKKQHGDDAGAEDSSEYDDDSPRGQAPGYNVGESTPFTTVKTHPPSSHETHSPSSHETHSPSSHERTSPRDANTTTTTGYDAQNRNYGADAQRYPSSEYRPTAPPSRPPPPLATNPSPRSTTTAPTLEDKFKYLNVGEGSPRDRNYPTSTTTEGVSTPKMGYPGVAQDTNSNPSSPGKLASVKDSIVGSVTSAAAVVGSKMGYYREVDDTPPAAPRNPNAPTILDKTKATLGLDKPRDPNAPTMMEKTKATLGLDKPSDPNAPTMMEKTKATLGLDKPSDPNAPSVMDKTKATLGLDKPRDPTAPTLLEKTKATLGLDKPRDPNAPPPTEKAKSYMASAGQTAREYSATASDRAAWNKDRVAAQTSPTHHDKALSEQVTQTLSSLPGTIKEKVFGPASPTNTVTLPKEAGNPPGIVDRVSGAVSSLFTAPPKDSGHDPQQTFPAHSDYVQPASTAPRTFADRSSAEERMPTTSTPAYPMVNS